MIDLKPMRSLTTNIRIPLGLALVIAIALFVPATRQAEASSAGAARNAKAIFEALRLKLNLGVRDQFQQGLLKKGGHVILQTTLHAGNHYVLVAGGCEDAYDVDIAVFDEAGNLISKDADEEKVAVAHVRPESTGTFLILIKMYNSTNNGAHWILQTGFRNLKDVPESPSEPSSPASPQPSGRQSL